jgi:MFS family permease
MVTLCVGISNFLWLPLSGALSDRVGRRPILIVCAVLAILTAYPALAWAVSSPSFYRLLLVELWLSFIYGGYNGAMIVYLTEMMPAEVRASGFSLAYSLATALFGGFTPYISTWLIGWTHNQAVPGAWLTLAAVASLLAILIPGRRVLNGANPTGATGAA